MAKKILSELSNEELWALFSIVLSEYKPECKDRYLSEEKLLRSMIGERGIYPETAKEYTLLKQSLAITYRNNRDCYVEAKTEFIRNCTRLTREDKIRSIPSVF